MLLPPPLQPGAKLKAIAPSGTLRDKELTKFEQGLTTWREQGYQVDVDGSFQAQKGYLAGDDEVRRRALKEAWHNPDYQGILCIRGGYGSARLLENWRWENPSAPKWLMGFSDVTGLLWSLASENIISLHAPVLTTIAQESEASLKRLFSYLEGESLPPLQGTGKGAGKAQGKLLAGNLTVATHILGSWFCPSFDGVILALEDVQEAPYKIDRMLTQWRLMGILSQLKGIALGRFSGCQAPDGIPSLTVEQVLQDRLGDLNIPIITDLPFGHDGVNFCLPVGALVEIDGDNGLLSFL